MTKPLGVILAGGLSRRMGGGDKGLLVLDGQDLLARVITQLEPQVPQMMLNANGDATRFTEYGLPVVADSIDGFAGPLAGVLAGLDWAAEQGATQIATVAADTPFFPADLVVRMMAAAKAQNLPLAMAMTPDSERGQARHPTFGLWSVALRDDLRAELNNGVRKVVQWTQPHGCAKVHFDAMPFDPFFNVNTPGDMLVAEQMVQEFDL